MNQTEIKKTVGEIELLESKLNYHEEVEANLTKLKELGIQLHSGTGKYEKFLSFKIDLILLSFYLDHDSEYMFKDYLFEAYDTLEFLLSKIDTPEFNQEFIDSYGELIKYFTIINDIDYQAKCELHISELYVKVGDKVNRDIHILNAYNLYFLDPYNQDKHYKKEDVHTLIEEENAYLIDKYFAIPPAIKSDPIEQSPEYKKIRFDLLQGLHEHLEKETDKRHPYMIWPIKKQILKEKYHIAWKSPKDLNPCIMFD